MVYDELIAMFGEAMRERLVANNWKGGWSSMTPKQILRRVEQEVRELRRAVEERTVKPETHKRRVIKEAADVGNFLAFLVYNMKKREGQ